MHRKFHGSSCPPEKCSPNQKNVKCTNGQIIKYTLEGYLDLPMITDISRKSHTFTNIKHSLVSIGSLCDAECTVTFKIKYFIVIYKGKIIIQGEEITRINFGISHHQSKMKMNKSEKKKIT